MPVTTTIEITPEMRRRLQEEICLYVGIDLARGDDRTVEQEARRNADGSITFREMRTEEP